MSTKSSQHGGPKQIFSKKMVVTAGLILIVFLTIIIAYPRIFNPSNVGRNTEPIAPGAPIHP